MASQGVTLALGLEAAIADRPLEVERVPVRRLHRQPTAIGIHPAALLPVGQILAVEFLLDRVGKCAGGQRPLRLGFIDLHQPRSDQHLAPGGGVQLGTTVADEHRMQHRRQAQEVAVRDRHPADHRPNQLLHPLPGRKAHQPLALATDHGVEPAELEVTVGLPTAFQHQAGGKVDRRGPRGIAVLPLVVVLALQPPRPARRARAIRTQTRRENTASPSSRRPDSPAAPATGRASAPPATSTAASPATSANSTTTHRHIRSPLLSRPDCIRAALHHAQILCHTPAQAVEAPTAPTSDQRSHDPRQRPSPAPLTARSHPPGRGLHCPHHPP